MTRTPDMSCNSLDLDSALQSLALLLLPGVGLGAHDATTPVTPAFLVLVRVTLLDGRDQLAELALVLAPDLGESQNGGGLLVNDGAETCLALDDGVWNWA